MCGYVGSEAQLYSEAIIDTGYTGFVKTADIIEQLALSNGEGLFAQCQAITFEASVSDAFSKQ